MFCTETWTGSRLVKNPALVDAILALDRENMSPILGAAGINNFDWKRRLRGLTDDTTIWIGSFGNQRLLGYIEYCRDWGNKKNIYLTSFQIRQEARNGRTFAWLAAALAQQLRTEHFEQLTSDVQESNAVMIGIFQKLGFQISREPGKKTFRVVGNQTILEDFALLMHLKAQESKRRRP